VSLKLVVRLKLIKVESPLIIGPSTAKKLVLMLANLGLNGFLQDRYPVKINAVSI
jgi:hypothetical protein